MSSPLYTSAQEIMEIPPESVLNQAGASHVWGIARRLASVYLSEHAEDDDQPITKTWLRRALLEKDLWLLYRGEELIPYVLAKRSHGIAWVQCGPTRGDVRRLCKALGVSLRDTV